MIKRISILFLFLVAIFSQSIAQDGIPERPSPPRLVNDYVGILSTEEVQQLEYKLVKFDDSTSNQIVIAIVNDFAGYDRADFAYRLGEKWGVGQKDKDNGIVIVVKPTGGSGERQAFIAPGKGLEGVIPDATAKRIVDTEMISLFKENKYYEGLDVTTSRLMSLALGEFSSNDYMAKTKKSPLVSLIPFIIFIIIFIIMRLSNARSYSAGKNIPFWTALFLASSMRGGGSSGSSFGNFSSGGGSFGGFGGGSFGGGGAGGSW